MKTIEDLLKIGFKKAGYWQLNPENRIKYVVDNELLILEHLLYAFESDGIVKYIGITEKTLRCRLINYKNAKEESSTAGSTNKKINKGIKELLLKKTVVNIYILKNTAPCDFYGYEISLATGIEKSLISAFDINDNLWNSRGTNNCNPPKIENKYRVSIKAPLSNNQTVLKLGVEAKKGILLFRNDVDKLLPEDSDDMDIYFNGEVLNGHFTRSGDKKYTNGYNRLAEIINKYFEFEEYILVTVLNKNEVRIEKITS